MSQEKPQHDHAQRVSDAAEAAQFWDRHYRQRDQPWSGVPNAFLVAAVAGREPGTALELGCGDGGDAIWLAGQGWRVTAADISDTALRRLAERAIAAGVGDRVHVERHDLAQTFPTVSADLVAQLGCAIDDSPAGLLIRVDALGCTTIPGIFAAGDAAVMMKTLPAAVATSYAAGAAAHQSLLPAIH